MSPRPGRALLLQHLREREPLPLRLQGQARQARRARRGPRASRPPRLLPLSA
jgi:hypothetical protein